LIRSTDQPTQGIKNENNLEFREKTPSEYSGEWYSKERREYIGTSARREKLSTPLLTVTRRAFSSIDK